VIVCLVASLFECLIVLPAHYLDWGSRHHSTWSGAEEGPEQRSAVKRFLASIGHIRSFVDRGIDGLRVVYLRALDVVLANRSDPRSPPSLSGFWSCRSAARRTCP
jgi:hypothetical protein